MRLCLRLSACTKVASIVPWPREFWRFASDRRMNRKMKRIFCFPPQVLARSAGRITAPAQGRPPPCCCVPGCPVSQARSRSSTHTEGGEHQRDDGRRRPTQTKGERTLWTSYSTSGAKDTQVTALCTSRDTRLI